MIRSEPLASFDAPLADRQSIGWAIFADVLCGLNQPEPTVLSWPCPTCGDHRIKCDCTEVGEDIFGDGK